MNTTQVVYDTTTGRILAAHHFRGEPADPESTRRAIIDFAEIGGMDLIDAQVGVIPVSDYPTDATRQYKVDVETSTLVEIAAGADESGVGFDFAGTPATGGETGAT